jgi:hypothetical protein
MVMCLYRCLLMPMPMPVLVLVLVRVFVFVRRVVARRLVGRCFVAVRVWVVYGHGGLGLQFAPLRNLKLL